MCGKPGSPDPCSPVADPVPILTAGLFRLSPVLAAGRARAGSENEDGAGF